MKCYYREWLLHVDLIVYSRVVDKGVCHNLRRNS